MPHQGRTVHLSSRIYLAESVAAAMAESASRCAFESSEDREGMLLTIRPIEGVNDDAVAEFLNLALALSLAKAGWGVEP